MCLRREWRVQRDHGCFARERLRVAILDAIFLCPFRQRIWIVSEYFHPESAQNLRGNATDLAGSENAGGFSMQIETDQTAQGEVCIAHPIVGAGDLAVERKQ